MKAKLTELLNSVDTFASELDVLIAAKQRLVRLRDEVVKVGADLHADVEAAIDTHNHNTAQASTAAQLVNKLVTEIAAHKQTLEATKAELAGAQEQVTAAAASLRDVQAAQAQEQG